MVNIELCMPIIIFLPLYFRISNEMFTTLLN